MKPRDLLKIGIMMAHHGEYEGERIVSKKWVKEATTPYLIVNEHDEAYGYQWWIQNFQGTRPISAFGHGGQVLVIRHEDKSVLVMTSQWRDFGGQMNSHLKKLRKLIMTAAEAIDQVN